MQTPETLSGHPEQSVFDTVELYLEPAGTGRRFANFLVDMIVAYVVVYGLVFVTVLLIPGLADTINEQSSSLSFLLLDRLITLLLWLLIYTFIEGVTKGRSLGKLLTSTVAVRQDGGPLTWKDAFMRSLIRMVPFEAFSGFSGYPWHDKWSKTCVINR